MIDLKNSRANTATIIDSEIDILKSVRNSIAVMRKYKEDNRLISDVKAFVAEDVFAELKKTGVMTQSVVGRYFLDNTPIFELKDYPRGYVSVE